LDNAPAQRPVLVKDFVAKNSMTTLEHLTYSVDLAAADSFLFLLIEISIDGAALL
jgi:hypothetical protein